MIKEEKEKIEDLKELFKFDDIFFKLDLATAVGILSFLGIPNDKIKEKYYELVSPHNFFKTSKPYVTTSKE